MAVEIERKFLLANDSWQEEVVHSVYITDGLLARADGRKIRIRLIGHQAWLAVKGPRNGISRLEFEYEIPYPDALIMMQSLCIEPTVKKFRHCVPFGGFTWAVDIHLGALAGVDFAEVELKHPDDALHLPPWVGEEVTFDPALRQEALLARQRKASRLAAEANLQH